MRAAISAVVLVWGLGLSHLAGESTQHSHDPDAMTYVCSMHPDVTSTVPGKCPRCGMALVPHAPGKSEAYRLDLDVRPEAIANQPLRLRLTVRDRESGEVVRDFAVVHEERYHLFVISEDLEYFNHMHPEQGQDGSWNADLVLPHTGRYRIYSDFLPEGGTPQMVALPLVTRGPGEGAASKSAQLVPDALLKRSAGDLLIRLEIPRGGLLAGRTQRLVYRFTDVQTGAPVTDLQPYLGAWGHTVILSEDSAHFVHAHPVEEVRPGRDGAVGGPTLTFETLLPAAGNYRIWTQVKRDGEVSTAVFTVAAQSPQAP